MIFPEDHAAKMRVGHAHFSVKMLAFSVKMGVLGCKIRHEGKKSMENQARSIAEGVRPKRSLNARVKLGVRV